MPYPFRNFNKYGAKKTESELIGRTFDSKAEARRAEELWLLQQAGQIKDLEFQVKYQLCDKVHYKVQIKVDFRYIDMESGATILEDCKGMEMRDFRVKRCWMMDKYGLDILISK